jgi:hypothetical protein
MRKQAQQSSRHSHGRDFTGCLPQTVRDLMRNPFGIGARYQNNHQHANDEWIKRCEQT